MVNKEQLDLIKKGVSTWNEWIWKNAIAEIMPEIDLSNADLSNANLRNADFRNADFRSANLSNANLSNANLSGADLRRADFSRANLSKAYFWNANLSSANLSGVDLSNANLSNAKLIGANLKSANLSNADLSNADLGGTNLRNAGLVEANLIRADLNGADLSYADLIEANLSGANLSNANPSYANLSGANLSGADLNCANLSNAELIGANLSEANLIRVNLNNANLSRANMIGTNLNKANLTKCRIYGVSAWDLKLQETIQSDLIITEYGDPAITVDNIEIAQFIYLLLKNEKIRQVIDTITSKVVLILGRFTPERKEILDALRDELRKRNYSPVLFDFEKPASRDLMETVTLLARMARFIIADITDAKSIPAELERIVPDLPSVPIQPLMLKSDHAYALFERIKCFPWVLPAYLYDTYEGLLAVLGEAIITPAEKKSQEIREKSSKN